MDNVNINGYGNLNWGSTPEDLLKIYNNASEIENAILENKIIKKIPVEFYQCDDEVYGRRHKLQLKGNIKIYIDKRIPYNEIEDRWSGNCIDIDTFKDDSYGTYRYFIYLNNKLFKVIVVYIIYYEHKLLLENIYNMLVRKYGRFHHEPNGGIYNYFSNDLFVKYLGVIKAPKPFIGNCISVSYYNQILEEKLLDIEY